MNGSPLFTGDAGSGESEIRRWILENDLLEALVALPEQLFYNTGIATYVWVLTNRKAPERKGKVQLIDATSFWVPMRKSLGDKRREIPDRQGQPRSSHSLERVRGGRALSRSSRPPTSATARSPSSGRCGSTSRQRPSASRGWRRRRRSRSSPSRKKKDPQAKAAEEAAGREQQEAIRTLLAALPDTLFKDRDEFEQALEEAAEKATALKLDAPVRKADPLRALRARRDRRRSAATRTATPSPTPSCATPRACRSSETIDDFFEREVKPHVPDAWIDTASATAKDGEVGMVGYEINFNRYFYRYTPPRPLEEIEADLKAVEDEILDLLKQVTE